MRNQSAAQKARQRDAFYGKGSLASARNDNIGKAVFSYLPPSSGRRGPEEAETHSRYRLKKNVRYAFPRFVIPSPAEGSFSFPVSLFLRNAVHMKHRDPTSHGVRCFPLSAVLTCLSRSRTKKDFSLPLEMTIRGKRHSRISLLLLEGGAPKRRRLAHTIG